MPSPDSLILLLKMLSCLSLGLCLTLLILRNAGGIFVRFRMLAGAADGFKQKQKNRFERQSRYLYRRKGGLFYKLNVKLAKAGMLGWLNAISVSMITVAVLITSFIIVSCLVRNTLLSFFISAIISSVPYMLIGIITQINLSSIEKHMLYNMETLLNFVSLDKGNIRKAYLDACKYFKPDSFRKHTEIFSFQIIQRNFTDAVAAYKKIVDIKVYGDFLDVIAACERIGGDYEKLVSHFTERLAVLQKAKISRIARSTSVRIAIYFLILANIGFFFLLKYSNPKGYSLVTNNPLIMSFVFFAMLIVMYLGSKAGKLKI